MIKAVLHRLPVRLVTQSGVKRKRAEQVPQLVVNRGRVRHVTFGTGPGRAKVVESAGVVRVKVTPQVITKLVSDSFKYILADGHARCVLLDNRYTLVDSETLTAN